MSEGALALKIWVRRGMCREAGCGLGGRKSERASGVLALVLFSPVLSAAATLGFIAI